MAFDDYANHKHCKEGKHLTNLCRMLIFFIISPTDLAKYTDFISQHDLTRFHPIENDQSFLCCYS